MLKQNGEKPIYNCTEDSTESGANYSADDLALCKRCFKFAFLGGILGGLFSFLLRQL